MKSVEEKETQASALTPVEQAAAEIAQFGRRELELVLDRQAKAGQMKEAEERAGAEYLDGQSGGAVDKVLKLQLELAAIGRAGDLCHARRLAAITRKWSAEASELREQIAGKQEQIEALQAKTAVHLAALSDLEGVPYSNEILRSQPNDLNWKHVPRSVALERGARALGDRLEVLERRKIATSGVIDIGPDEVTGIEALLAAVAAHEGETPGIEAVLDWCAACERGTSFGELARRYRLAWKEGTIDVCESYTLVPDLVGSMLAGIHGVSERPDVNSATFRADASFRVHAT
ncbi:MAG TPA: hypothetical protein VGE83_10150 [Terracidiphilus sp.]|jgi:hypothetical protein